MTMFDKLSTVPIIGKISEKVSSPYLHTEAMHHNCGSANQEARIRARWNLRFWQILAMSDGLLTSVKCKGEDNQLFISRSCRSGK